MLDIINAARMDMYLPIDSLHTVSSQHPVPLRPLPTDQWSITLEDTRRARPTLNVSSCYNELTDCQLQGAPLELLTQLLDIILWRGERAPSQQPEETC